MGFYENNLDKQILVKQQKTSMPIKLHEHDGSEIIYMVKGSGVYTVADREYRFADGSLFFVPSGVGHMISFDSETEFYEFLVTDDAVEKIKSVVTKDDTEKRRYPEIVSSCTEDAYLKMCKICAISYNEYMEGFFGNTEILNSQILVIYVYLLRYAEI